MGTAPKKSIFFVIANILGIAIYLVFAYTTWNIDYAISGFRLSIDALLMVGTKFLFLIVNLIWAVLIAVDIRRFKAWLPLLVWLSSGMLWMAAIRYDNYRFGIEVEKAKKELDQK